MEERLGKQSRYMTKIRESLQSSELIEQLAKRHKADWASVSQLSMLKQRQNLAAEMITGESDDASLSSVAKQHALVINPILPSGDGVNRIIPSRVGETLETKFDKEQILTTQTSKSNIEGLYQKNPQACFAFESMEHQIEHLPLLYSAKSRREAVSTKVRDSAVQDRENDQKGQLDSLPIQATVVSKLRG
jgi:hypothetical protein